MMAIGSPLFERVVEATGLNEVVAPFTVTRLLLRHDIRATELTAEDLERALPEIENGIAVYLSADEHARACERLRALAGS